MVRQQGNLFVLETRNTSYLFGVGQTGHLEHLHYGRKVRVADAGPLFLKQHFLRGCTVAYSKEHPAVSMEMTPLEASAPGKGDVREPIVELVFADGSTTCDFRFESAKVLKEKPSLAPLPSSYDEAGRAETLKVVLREASRAVLLELYYTTFEECDVIARSARVVNEGEEELLVRRLLSVQVDFFDGDYVFTTFHGGWTREMGRQDIPCQPGILVSDSKQGTSGNHANPFVMLSRRGTTEDHGECYGFNLVYSGNHYEAAEVGISGGVRFLSGIHPWNFSFRLGKGESFQSPEGVMAFSPDGFQGMSHRMHAFVREHIVRGAWKRKERPVALNSWEAAYFNFTEGKLLAMAKEARKVGIELFVMDDGWFGKRDDDTSSLGDWEENREKLPKGLAGIARKVRDLGMGFGIWVEPEMVSEDSDCFRAHPDWAIRVPGREHSEGRNEMFLDLTREDVREYVIGAMRRVFSTEGLTYVKWDMNRHFSEYYSAALPADRQQEVGHRYVLGLYEVMGALTSEFPDILFEGCASGGNRFDLGVLCFMPQIWASDDTDAYARAAIQTGYSYGYPMSVVSAHVSDCPNHQTLRSVSLDTRFHVAAAGILGYECNVSELGPEERERMKEQIALYKAHRRQLQFGEYYRIRNGEDGLYQWMCVSEDKTFAAGVLLAGAIPPNQRDMRFRAKGLANDKLYHFHNEPMQYNIKEFGGLVNAVSPVHIRQGSLLQSLASKVIKLDGEREDCIAYGSLLNYRGVQLCQPFVSSGFDDQTRLFKDFSSRMYLIEEQEEGKEEGQAEKGLEAAAPDRN